MELRRELSHNRPDAWEAAQSPAFFLVCERLSFLRGEVAVAGGDPATALLRAARSLVWGMKNWLESADGVGNTTSKVAMLHNAVLLTMGVFFIAAPVYLALFKKWQDKEEE